MNDFTSATVQNALGGNIYGCAYTGISPDIINTPTVVGQWRSVNPSFDFGMAKQFRQHLDDNLSTASLVAYSPISATYNMSFSRPTQDASTPDTYIRIDMIQPKRRFLNSTTHSYNMPHALGSFQEMAISNSEGMRNRYNTALWTVSTKYLKIKSVPPPANGAPFMKNNGASIKLYKSFDRKTIRLNLDQIGTGQFEEYYLAVDPGKQTWCVISSSEGVTPNVYVPLEVNLQRTIRYRDQHGIST